MDDWWILIIDLEGESLEKLFNKSGKTRGFRLETVLKMGIQMVDRLEALHSIYFLHRDIKPDNFLVGKSDKGKIFCIDFGLSKSYVSRRNKDENGDYKHIKMIEGKSLIGTARYASI